MTFEDVLKLAIKQRPGYQSAVGLAKDLSIDQVPSELTCIYSVAAGTHRSINDLKLMDLVPGFRLIHKAELGKEIEVFIKNYSDLREHIPFLADFSACYFTLNKSDQGVYRVAPEYGSIKLADSLERFWQTIYSFYHEGVYFLDSDGYLDFEYDQEGEIGSRINPECDYWNE